MRKSLGFPLVTGMTVEPESYRYCVRQKGQDPFRFLKAEVKREPFIKRDSDNPSRHRVGFQERDRPPMDSNLMPLERADVLHRGSG